MIKYTMEYFLQEIVDATEYNALYCGHWHTEKQDGMPCTFVHSYFRQGLFRKKNLQ